MLFIMRIHGVRVESKVWREEEGYVCVESADSESRECQ